MALNFRTILFLVLTSLTIACERDPDSVLGDDMHSDTALIEAYNDTIFEIIAFSIPDDAISLQNNNYYLLGSIYDKTFGLCDYNIATELSFGLLSSVDKFNPEYSIVDSVVLILNISGYYPINKDDFTDNALEFSIHELEEKLKDDLGIDSVYATNYDVKYDNTPIEDNIKVFPKPFDTVNYGFVKIMLNTTFWKDLLTRLPPEAYEEGALADYFNGLYFKSKTSTGINENIAVSFWLEPEKGSNLRVYYDNVAGSTAETERYKVFNLGRTAFASVKRSRDLSSSLAYKKQMDGDTLAGKEELFIQSYGGSNVRFKIPNIKDISDNEIILNRAELIMTNLDFDVKGIKVDVPSFLECFKYIGPNEAEALLDKSTNMGGEYDSKTGEYKILLTRHIQELIYKDKEFNYIDIAPPIIQRKLLPYAVRLGGVDNTIKMKLRVIYTELPIEKE